MVSIIGEKNLIFDRFYQSIGLRFFFLMTTIDLIDVFSVNRLSASIHLMFFDHRCPTMGTRTHAKALGHRAGYLETRLRYLDTKLNFLDTRLRYLDNSIRYLHTRLRNLDTRLMYLDIMLRQLDTMRR